MYIAIKNNAVMFLCLLASVIMHGQIEITKLGDLPSVVNENSGLIFYNGKLITHNDSGNEPVLYEIDTVSLAVTREIQIVNASNVDWEDITQDENYIYIGDIGNNIGQRTNLGVYKISKQEFNSQSEINAELIEFAYEDQSTFENEGNSDWDAESLVVLEGNLVVLTKQWKSLQTVAYSFPNTVGNHIARRIGEFDSKGLVTAATYVEEQKMLYFLGHSTILTPFVYQVTNPTLDDIFAGETIKLDATLDFGQTEGLAYISNNRFFIASEFFSRTVPAITLMPQLTALQLPVEEEENPEEENPEEENPGEEIPGEEVDFLFSIYDGNNINTVSYKIVSNDKVLARAVYTVTGKMIQFDTLSNSTGNEVDISTLKTGVYYLVLYLGDEVVSKPFLVK